MANQVYNTFKAKIGTIDWSDNVGEDIRVMLVTSTYVPDIDTHEFIDDVTNEVVGTGYTAGGQLLVGRAVTPDLVNDWAEYDATDLTWASSTITARGAVVYRDTGTPATSELITYVDFVSDKTSSNGDFVIVWHGDGVFRLG